MAETRLKLKPNDTLRIRLVNKLPPVPDALHCNPDLVNNPNQSPHTRV